MGNNLRSRIVAFLGTTVVVCGLLTSGSVHGQGLLYSFETPDDLGTPDLNEGLEGWGLSGFGTAIGVNTSTNGASQGAHSMRVEKAPGFSWDVNTTVSSGDIYDKFNTVAANLAGYTLDFDVTLTPDSFSAVSAPGSFFLMNVAANSDSPNFPSVFNVTPNLLNQIGKFPVSIPMTSLPVAENSSYYQLTIGSNSTHTAGPNGEGIRYYVDNIRLTALPTFVETKLFSWETPDNPETAVNEQYEGWTEGFNPGHVHSISTLGATDGTSTLQIDRTGVSSGFSWGSQFTISGGAANPSGQAIIDQLVAGINGATSIAFDVRFDDSFPNSPTFTKFGLHVTDHRADNSFSFFGGEGPSFNGVQTIGDTATVTIPLTSLVDGTRGSLASAGLTVGTDFLRIGISTNTSGGGIYQIDNFRLLSVAPTLAADFNDDTKVDAADLAIWKSGFGSNATGDADGDGDSDGADYLVWQREFGSGVTANAAVGAVPEPSSLALAAGLIMAAAYRRR
ncbi:MAG: PEP-CTERM sorting domain-containing protein [Planctomycetaceae bacterium]|nr:PEP-CTERM sorting domain-containing protein [Planctomycetaceae bacterium]